MPLSVFEINHLFQNEWIESSSAVLMPTSVLQKYVCLSSFHYTDMAHKCTTLSPLQNVHKQERLQIFWGGLKTGIPSTIEILYSSVPYQLLHTYYAQYPLLNSLCKRFLLLLSCTILQTKINWINKNCKYYPNRYVELIQYVPNINIKLNIKGVISNNYFRTVRACI